jgi:hypothetical protein
MINLGAGMFGETTNIVHAATIILRKPAMKVLNGNKLVAKALDVERWIGFGTLDYWLDALNTSGCVELHWTL